MVRTVSGKSDAASPATLDVPVLHFTAFYDSLLKLICSLRRLRDIRLYSLHVSGVVLPRADFADVLFVCTGQLL